MKFATRGKLISIGLFILQTAWITFPVFAFLVLPTQQFGKSSSVQFKNSKVVSTPSFLSGLIPKQVFCNRIYNNIVLFGGTGVTKDYCWTEEQFEIEITVTVPEGTKGSDIKFKSSPDSIDLKLSTKNDQGEEEDAVLLDGTRKMRGKLNMDGTFWSITDGEKNNRLVTVTIEKYRSPQQNDMFGTSEDDWGGVYPDDEDEIIERKYKEAEEMDVREYAKSLGVDIDNLNMSLVDKTMFSVANMTKGTMDDLQKGGYVKEITKQGDQEFEDKDGTVIPFQSPFGEMIATDDLESGKVKIPFIDDEIEDDESKDKDTKLSSTSKMVDKKAKQEPKKEIPSKSVKEEDVDPLDSLTVARLKEILREQNLKVSGTKQELRDRLRAHVNSLLLDMGKKMDSSDDDEE